MTEAERTAEDRRDQRMAELDDGSCVSVGGLHVALQKFPPPDLTGMTPEEETAAVEKWIDAIVQWQRETTAAQGAEPATPVPPRDTTPTQAPVA